jgi:Condensation domain
MPGPDAAELMRIPDAGPRPTSLAPCQETQWEFMYALSPDDPGRAFHVVVENRYLEGALDRAALMRAFEQVTRRHEGLRLVLEEVAPDARVRILDRIDLPVEHLDLSGLDETRRSDAVHELSYHENRRCFDLRSGPLWHAWVVRLDATTHLLNACFSHIIADGWAPKVFVEDLLGAYGALVGAAAPLADDALTFAEIHALQNRRLAAVPERQRFWREHLLPLKPWPPADSMLVENPDADLMARERIDFWIPSETQPQIRRVAWRARTTAFVALQAAYHLVICMARGTERSVLNTAMHGRATDREKRALLQFAVDPYVGTAVPEGGTLLDMVRATSESVGGSIEHAMSYTSIARAINPDFDAQRPWPAFHFCDGGFIDTAFFDPHSERAGMQVTQVFIPGERPAGYVPAMVAGQLSGAIAHAWEARSGPGMLIYPKRNGGRLRFNGHLHTRESMQDLLDRFLWVVEAVAWRPEMRIDDLRRDHAGRFGREHPAGRRP